MRHPLSAGVAADVWRRGAGRLSAVPCRDSLTHASGRLRVEARGPESRNFPRIVTDSFRNVGVAQMQRPAGDRREGDDRRNEGIHSRKPRSAAGRPRERWPLLTRATKLVPRCGIHEPQYGDAKYWCRSGDYLQYRVHRRPTVGGSISLSERISKALLD